MRVNRAVFLCHRFLHKQKAAGRERDGARNGLRTYEYIVLLKIFFAVLQQKMTHAYDSCLFVLFLS